MVVATNSKSHRGLASLVKSVRAQSTVVASTESLINGIAQHLKADDVDAGEYADQLERYNAELANAVIQGTSAAKVADTTAVNEIDGVQTVGYANPPVEKSPENTPGMIPSDKPVTEAEINSEAAAEHENA